MRAGATTWRVGPTASTSTADGRQGTTTSCASRAASAAPFASRGAVSTTANVQPSAPSRSRVRANAGGYVRTTDGETLARIRPQASAEPCGSKSHDDRPAARELMGRGEGNGESRFAGPAFL